MTTHELENCFKLIGKDWMLITAKSQEGKVNTMTASWGGFGHLWNKDVVYIFIRPQRHTLNFIDDSEYFTLSFFEDKYKKELAYFGKVSGKNEDKIGKSGFNLKVDGEFVSFEEERIVLKCRKLAKQQIDPKGFIDESIQGYYPENDYHYMFIGEIVKVEQK